MAPKYNINEEFSYNNPRYQMLGGKLHVKKAAYLVLVGAILLPLILVPLWWIFTVSNALDLILPLIALVIIIVSLLAIYANYKELQSLYSPFIVTMWILSVVLSIIFIFAVVMIIANPLFWQNWTRWVFDFDRDTETHSASRWLAVLLALLSLLLVFLYTFYITTITKAKNFAFDKSKATSSARRLAQGPETVQQSGTQQQSYTYSQEHIMTVNT